MAEIRDAANQRRVSLIRKDLAGGLTIEEAAELDRLEREVARYVDALHPAPNCHLAEMLDRALQLEQGR